MKKKQKESIKPICYILSKEITKIDKGAVNKRLTYIEALHGYDLLNVYPTRII